MMPGCTCTYSFPSRQSGAALLAFSLLLIVGTSYLLLKELNVNFIQLKQQQETRDVLEQSRQALIGYSVSYPDHHPGMGPGILPCPDRNKDGSAVANCSFSGQTTIGRFPWRTVGIPEPRDSHGETLWYVVADNFRTPPPGAINSETSGDLVVDGNTGTEIVALIIAPGAPVGNQERDHLEDDVLVEIDNYLEGDNANLDTLFVSIASGDFDDQVIFITREELMFAVEKRVLGEVFQTLDTYRTDHSAYPWLSTFTDPAASAFRAQLDDTATPKTGWQGHLPFHRTADTPGSSNRNPFQTAVSWAWNTDVGTATGSFSGTVTADCLRNVDCDDGLFPPIPTVDAASIDCRWVDDDPNDSIPPREIADCDPSGWITMTSITCDMGCGNSGTCSRSYHVEFPLYTGTSVTLGDPSSDAFRTRSVDRAGSLPVQNSAVQIVDTYSGPTVSSLCLLSETVTVGSGNINFTTSTTGSITTSKIHYDIDIDDGEIPEWFTTNDWHEHIYVAYPESESLPGSVTTSCTAGTDCLVVNGFLPDSDTRGVVVIAGDIISTTLGQDRSPGADITDYFELENADQNQMYQMSSIYELRNSMDTTDPNDDINDQLKILATP